MSDQPRTVDTSTIYDPRWFRMDGEDRAQSIAVSHATLLALAITLIGGVAATGAGPLSDAQAEVMVGIAEDRFDEWDEDVRNAIQTEHLQRESMTVPTGVYAGGDITTITIEENGNSEREIETQHFVYSPRGSDQTVRYDSGLVTRQQSQTSIPTVRSSPQSTHLNSNTDEVYVLNLIKYDLAEPVVFQTAYNRDITYNVSADSVEDKSYSSKNVEGNDVTIVVEGGNYQAWERYFNDNANNTDSEEDIFESVSVEHDEQRVEAKLDVETFLFESQYVKIERATDHTD